MKRFRIVLAALLLIVLGTSFVFADITPIPVLLVKSGALYGIIAVIVLIIALVLLGRSIRKRRSRNDDIMQPEDPGDIDPR